MGYGCACCYDRGYNVVWTIPGKTPVYDENGVQVGVARVRECVRLPCSKCGANATPEPEHRTHHSEAETLAIAWFMSQKNLPTAPFRLHPWASVVDPVRLYETLKEALADELAPGHYAALRDVVALHQRFSTIVEEPAFPAVVEEPAFPSFIEEPAF